MYWNFTHHGKLHEYEADSKSAIKEKADEWFADYSRQQPLRNGAICRDEVTLLQMNDDAEVVSSEPMVVEYEHYHGDFVEHGFNG